MTPLLRRAIAYTVILVTPLVMIRAFQDHLLYFAEPLPAADYQRAAAAAGLAPWPSRGELRGLVREASNRGHVAGRPAGHGTAVVLHGNAGLALHRDFYADALSPLGFRIVLLEYPKYGPRKGRLGEDAFVADAIDSLRLLRTEQPGPLLLIGESLGAGVAAAVAAAAPETLDALLLITPWDTLADIAAHYYPWLPVRLLLTDRYDTVSNLSRFAKPITLAIAEHDEIIPPRLSNRLARELGPRARRVVIPGARHNDWPDRLDAEWWRREAAQLLPITGEHPSVHSEN